MSVDGKEYGGGFSMGEVGIGYRKEVVKEEGKRWSEVWRSELKGKVGISCGSY